jgi:hypothetical protein
VLWIEERIAPCPQFVGMRPSNPPGSVALFQNCESVAIAPQFLEEMPRKGENALSLYG